MDRQDLVSVIIPTYNRGQLVFRAIKSVLNQTYKNLEIIIVDDGSTDDTEEIVKKFSDERIKYIRYPKNRGLSFARNTGIRNSKGDFVAFLDSDDEYIPEKIEKTLRVFKNSSKDLGLVASNFWRIVDGKKKIMYSRWTPFLPFAVFRKDALEKNGFFDEGLEILIDLEFYTRFIGKFPAYYIYEPLGIYHITKGSISFSSNLNRQIEIKKMILKRYASDLKKSRYRIAHRKLGCINYYLGKDHLQTGLIKEARRYFLEAFLAYPIKVEYFGRFVSTYFKKIKKRGENK
jgi:glycosyltransferase involved in cell wall biosynthesis